MTPSLASSSAAEGWKPHPAHPLQHACPQQEGTIRRSPQPPPQLEDLASGRAQPCCAESTHLQMRKGNGHVRLHHSSYRHLHITQPQWHLIKAKHQAHKHLNTTSKNCFGTDPGSWLQETVTACRQNQSCLPGFAHNSTAALQCARLCIHMKPDTKPTAATALTQTQLCTSYSCREPQAPASRFVEAHHFTA